jgi:hypothetical protein
VKLCVKLDKTAAESHNVLLEAYCNEDLYKTIGYKWHKHFQSGRTSTADDESLGQPYTLRNNSLTAHVKDIINANYQLTV